MAEGGGVAVRRGAGEDVTEKGSGSGPAERVSVPERKKPTRRSAMPDANARTANTRSPFMVEARPRSPSRA
jgi:hypothetical protein